MSQNISLDRFGTELRRLIEDSSIRPAGAIQATEHFEQFSGGKFSSLALELFALQFRDNLVYREFCIAQGTKPMTITDWSRIPAVPTSAFKELDLSCLCLADRTVVFHSSGTSLQRPSRHFHCAESLALYEASLVSSFRHHVFPDSAPLPREFHSLALTPPKTEAPHSSLVYMFDVLSRKLGFGQFAFLGRLGAENEWCLDLDVVCKSLDLATRSHQPMLLLGTAFSFVHLLDHLADRQWNFKLPAHSRLLETGGYKGRSRSLSKVRLHSLLTERLGIAPSHIVSEYGMSELSSQAYDIVIGRSKTDDRFPNRLFHFPPWVRVQIISPETGEEVREGETGLIRIFDLANVYSVMAIQTEDLAVRRSDGFELLGRALNAEPRGCSLTALA